MKTLNLIQIQQVAGGTLTIDNCYLTVPSTGLSAAKYKKIDSAIQNLFNNENSMKDAVLPMFALLDHGIEPEDLAIYTDNMLKANKICY